MASLPTGKEGLVGTTCIWSYSSPRAGTLFLGGGGGGGGGGGNESSIKVSDFLLRNSSPTPFSSITAYQNLDSREHACT